MDSVPKTDPVPIDPEAEIERLKQELRQQRDMYLRAVADCDNYRKRVERDQAKAIRSGRRDLLLSLLDALDEFERAFLHAQQDPGSLLQGIGVVYRLLQNRISAEGVTAYDSKGAEFDPKYHEAVGTASGEEYEPGTVVEEIRRGYRWGDEVVRPARVIVAK